MRGTDSSFRDAIHGQTWATAAKAELTPQLGAMMLSRAELQVAIKEASLDQKTKGGSSWERPNELLSMGVVEEARQRERQVPDEERNTVERGKRERLRQALGNLRHTMR